MRNLKGPAKSSLPQNVIECCQSKLKLGKRGAMGALEFQALCYTFAEFGISFRKIVDHALLNRFVCFSQRISDVIN
jgi:hypothetical protein